MKRLKVLVSAYACEPNKGSEPEVGWNWVKQIARYHDVWVITRANNREVIEAELEKSPLPNVTFYDIDLPKWAMFWKKKQKGVHIYYYIWQILAYFIARKLHSRIKFDIVHHITFVSYRYPSFLSLLNTSFIWGPIGGGEVFPKPFFKELSFRGKLSESLRYIHQRLALLDPFVRLTMKKAEVIVVVNKDTFNIIPKKFQEKTYILPAIGMTSNDTPSKNSSLKDREKIEIICAGSLIPRKAFGLAIKSLKFLRNPEKYHLTIIGDGPDRRYLEQLVKTDGLKENVTFAGHLSRKEIFKNLQNCDVFLFPSLRDSGGFVILEAMSMGKPVISINMGGPAEIVTLECGIKIRPESPEQTTKDIANALEKLADDSVLREKMGAAGRKRVEEVYNWNKQGEEINEIYKYLMNER